MSDVRSILHHTEEQWATASTQPPPTDRIRARVRRRRALSGVRTGAIAASLAGVVGLGAWWGLTVFTHDFVPPVVTPAPSPSMTPSPSPSFEPGPIRDPNLDWDTAIEYLTNPRTGEVWLSEPQPIADPGIIPANWGDDTWFKIGERDGRDIVAPPGPGPFRFQFFEYDGTTLYYIVAPNSFDTVNVVDPDDPHPYVEYGVVIDRDTFYDSLSLPSYNPLSAPATNHHWHDALVTDLASGGVPEGGQNLQPLPPLGALSFDILGWDYDLDSEVTAGLQINIVAREVWVTTPFGFTAPLTHAQGPVLAGDSVAAGHPYSPLFLVENCSWLGSSHYVIQGSPQSQWISIGSTSTGEEVFAAVSGSPLTTIYDRLRMESERGDGSWPFVQGPDLGNHDGYATIGSGSTAPAFLGMPTGTPDEWFVFRANALFDLEGC